MVAIDVNVCDVSVGVIEFGSVRVRVLRRTRIKRPVHLISFVKRVNRRSQRLHDKPASEWLRYLNAREDQWINDSVSSIIKLAKETDAVVIEDLDAAALRRKLRSEDPELSARYSTWAPAKLARRMEAACRSRGLLLLRVNPAYTSHLCPRCCHTMTDYGRRRVRCPRCGLEDDRDHIAILNIARAAAIQQGLQYADTPLRHILREFEKRVSALILEAVDPGSREMLGESTPPQDPEAPGQPRGFLGGGA